MKKRLRPLALQATAAERAEKLRGEIASLRARVAELDLAGLARAARRRGEQAHRGGARAQARRRAARTPCSRSGAARRRSSPTPRAVARRRPPLCTACAARASGWSCAGRARRRCSNGCARSLSRPRRVLDARVRAEREALAEQARLARERLQTLERALAEREGLPPAARALAEEGERLALSLLDVEPGRERAVAAALGHRASCARRRRRARRAGARRACAGCRARQRRRPHARPDASSSASCRSCRRKSCSHSRVPAVTPEGFGYDPQRGEIWFAGETAEAVWLELEARRRALAAEVEELEARAEAPIPGRRVLRGPRSTDRRARAARRAARRRARGNR